MKQLLVNADDFGLCRGVTDGIIEAHQKGIVTSASLMATAVGFDYAVEQARANPTLGVGVHLTLVEEHPTCDPATIRTLAQADGRLPAKYGALLSGIVTRRILRDEIERELRAQIEKCLSTGLKLTHLDSHQHVHALPSLFKMVLKLGREYGIRGLRIPRDSPRWRGARSSGQLVQKTALCWLARYDGRGLARDVAACDQMVGLFDSGNLTESCLLRIIELLPEGRTELVSHPGLVTDDMQPYSHWKYDWGAELQALTSGRVRNALVARGVELIGYRELTQ